MWNRAKIGIVRKQEAWELYNSLDVCTYCKAPFKECDTIIPGKGVVFGEMDVVEYENRFWHYGCIFDYEKGRGSDKVAW
jgi:hypothetical protein